MKVQTVKIVGAGPAGLSTAISARGKGAKVVVHEKRPDVGTRFQGDFQGLENWTTDRDVLLELESMGIGPSFDHTPVKQIACFDASGEAYTLKAAKPIFYLVRRGSEPGTLDLALKTQALKAGVEIRFNSRQQHIPQDGVVAEGPHRADIIACGYVFDTDMQNGCYVAVSEQLAPAGYSYLLVDRGRGTVATCLFDRFHEERRFLENTVEFFQRTANLHWHRATRFGGIGNCDRVQLVQKAGHRPVGEAAGWQDALFGFGLRYALTSGYQAGATVGEGDDLRERDLATLHGLNSSSIVNRWFYARLGDRGRGAIIKHYAAGKDPRRLLHRIYAPKGWKQTLAHWIPRTPLWQAEPGRGDCDCTWCRCHRNTPQSGISNRV